MKVKKFKNKAAFNSVGYLLAPMVVLEMVKFFFKVRQIKTPKTTSSKFLNSPGKTKEKNDL